MQTLMANGSMSDETMTVKVNSVSWPKRFILICPVDQLLKLGV